MLRIKLVFWIGLVLLTGLWLAAAPDVFAASGVFALRVFMLQYSGLLAIVGQVGYDVANDIHSLAGSPETD